MKLDTRFVINSDKVDGFDANQSPTANQIPVLDSSKQLNLPFAPPNIKVAGQDYMSRTFYVDQTNGDDNNDGSYDYPFKSLLKAVNSVPAGGIGKISIVGDYTANDGEIWIADKYIDLFINSTVNVPIVQVQGSAVYNGLATVFHTTGNTTFNINFTGSGKINVGNSGYNSNNAWIGNREKLFTYSFESINLPLFRGRPQVNIVGYGLSANFLEFYQGALIGPAGGDARYSGSGFDLSVVCWNSTNANIVYHSDNSVGFLLQTSPPTNFFWYANLVDENGNSVDIKTKVSGIVKDSNGVPRNIVSNIVF